ncbi:AAA family ATPase [Paraburkholderia denitrificans]|uniref:AAA family ATPase n=1 Tax=Paraburkholderia denitrificans TaxID=694025 RepID=A0ABW0JA50_9BURK
MSDAPHPTHSQHRSNRLRAARRHSRAIDAALRRAATYPHPAGRIVRIETHISVVYLAGRYAYKIMKPVDFGFVDFTGLDARRRCGEAEIRLNRPFSGAIYLDVKPLSLDAGRCRLDRGNGSVIDYAVRMRRFDQRELFSNRVAHDELDDTDIDIAARKLAKNHLHAQRLVHGSTRAGTAALLRDQVLAALAPVERDPRTAEIARTAQLRRYCESELERLAAHLDARRANGFVRACHGDLHLDNLIRHGSQVLMFDCIEFSDDLRWIDVTADLAFLIMDLHAHGHARHANRLLARYLEATGDFGGLAALPLYVTYRALVRAMVALLKAGPPHAKGSTLRAGPYTPYLDLAAHATRARTPTLLLCHGLSGSGKSVASQALAEQIGAIRISSDIERKRVRPFAPPDLQTLPASAYTPEAIAAHYDRLVELATTVLGAGYTTLVDATFLNAVHRARFAALARRLDVPLLILHFHADSAVLVERVNARARGPRDALNASNASDAGEAVLAAQMASADPLDSAERHVTVDLDTNVPMDAFASTAWWAPLFERMHGMRETGTAPA